MHIVTNIRNLEKFLKFFPGAANNSLSNEESIQRYCAKDAKAYHYDLVIAKVVSSGATPTEDREGNTRELSLGEWIIAPLIGRESSYKHSSVLPREGVAVETVIDYINIGGGLGLSVDNPPGTGNPTKVKVMGVLRYDDGRIARSLDFARETRTSESLCPVVAIIGSRAHVGKTTVCFDVTRNLRENNKKIGFVKFSGTARLGELLEVAPEAHQWRDMADAGMPTTYPPSQENDDRTGFTIKEAIKAAERNIQALSVENDIVVAEFGGDLLSASVPEILTDPSRLNIVALVMVAESATAVIGMETKLYRISKIYESLPRYVVGPVANLRANRNRIGRETSCTGCYDLWNKHNRSAVPAQVEASISDTKEFSRKLSGNCGL